jgi:hypothetical protein
MAGLTQTQPQPNVAFRGKAKKKNGESDLADSAVYVRYKDHVLFKNLTHPIDVAMERETIGWLTKQTDEIMLIEHDRTVPNLQLPSGQGNGLIVLKSCIIEIHPLPLQKNSEWHLNSQENKDKAEYALQVTKRKTRNKQNKNEVEAEQCKP